MVTTVVQTAFGTAWGAGMPFMQLEYYLRACPPPARIAQSSGEPLQREMVRNGRLQPAPEQPAPPCLYSIDYISASFWSEWV